MHTIMMKLLIEMMHADSEPSPQLCRHHLSLFCSYVHCGIARAAEYELLMIYIEEDKMGVWQ